MARTVFLLLVGGGIGWMLALYIPQAIPLGVVQPTSENGLVDALITPPAEPLQMSGDDLVALPYEPTGGALSLPMTVEIEGGEVVEYWMVFDTGATLTTLHPQDLNALGLSPAKNAPEVTFRTANGMRKAALTLLPEVYFGGYAVGPVTVATCESCAEGEVRGLLGLNVTQRFLLTLDAAREEVLLQPRPGARSTDVKYWLDVSHSFGPFGWSMNVINRAPYDMVDVRLLLDCRPDEVLQIEEIPAGKMETVERAISMDSCTNGRLKVVDGRFRR